MQSHNAIKHESLTMLVYPSRLLLLLLSYLDQFAPINTKKKNLYNFNLLLNEFNKKTRKGNIWKEGKETDWDIESIQTVFKYIFFFFLIL